MFIILKNVPVWRSLNIVRAVFSLLAWLLFSIFISYDQTYDSLEKRDFTLLDDLAQETNQTKPDASKTTPNESSKQNNLDTSKLQQSNNDKNSYQL